MQYYMTSASFQKWSLRFVTKKMVSYDFGNNNVCCYRGIPCTTIKSSIKA